MLYQLFSPLPANLLHRLLEFEKILDPVQDQETCQVHPQDQERMGSWVNNYWKIHSEKELLQNLDSKKVKKAKKGKGRP